MFEFIRITNPFYHRWSFQILGLSAAPLFLHNKDHTPWHGLRGPLNICLLITLLVYPDLYGSPPYSHVATYTKYHRLGGLNSKLLSSQFGRPEAQGPGLRRAGFLSDLPPWLALFSRGLFSVQSTPGISFCVQMSSSYKGPSHIGLEPPISASF